MPISSPSYFPPQRNADRIVGLNAGLAQTGNYVFLAGENSGSNSTADGLIIVGHGAGSSNPGISGIAGAVLIGYQAGSGYYSQGNSGFTEPPVIIGSSAAQNCPSADGSVFIGSEQFGGTTASSGSSPPGPNQMVVIGCKIVNGTTNKKTSGGNSGAVVIGYNIAQLGFSNVGFSECVVIGTSIGTGASINAQGAVVIGCNACQNDGMPQNSVIIGAFACRQVQSTASDVTALGYEAGQPNVSAVGGSIYIGSFAGTGWPDTANQIVLVPNANPAGSAQSHFCSLGVGASAQFANIGLGGTTHANSNMTLANAENIVCLYNGQAGTANPVNGGYFYVAAGALHWVGSSGSDTQIAPA